MKIHLIAPKDRSQWREEWFKGYSFWEKSSYEVILWDDEMVDNLLIEDDPHFFNIINGLPPIFKYDYVRILFLEKFGGAYFDMDVEPKIDFLPLCDPNIIYISEGQPFVIDNGLKLPEKVLEFFHNDPLDFKLSNHIMISPPNIKEWTEIKLLTKEKVIEFISSTKLDIISDVVSITGPISLSRIVNQIDLKYKLLSYLHFDCGRRYDLAICIHYKTGNWIQ
jgi:hypothetical protein